MAKVLVPVANGTEEMEAVIVIDTLRRAKWEVVVAGLTDGPLTMSRGVRMVPDTTMDKVDTSDFDLIVIPGGAKGVENMRGSDRVKEAIAAMSRAGKMVAAVCAGPLVLHDARVLDGKKATCHPNEVSRLTRAQYVDSDVVVDGKIVTSRGAGTCFEFALKLIELFDGREKADAVAVGMVVQRA